jgi:hypothetical protein
MRIAVILFLLFSFVQNVLNIKADNIRRISVYAACFRLKLLNDFAKRSPYKKYPFWLIAANSLLSANVGKSRFAAKIALTKGYFIIKDLKGLSLKNPFDRFQNSEKRLKLLPKELFWQTGLRKATFRFCFILS